MYLVNVIGLICDKRILVRLTGLNSDGRFSITRLKRLTRFLNKALSFREASTLPAPPGNYLLE